MGRKPVRDRVDAATIRLRCWSCGHRLSAAVYLDEVNGSLLGHEVHSRTDQRNGIRREDSERLLKLSAKLNGAQSAGKLDEVAAVRSQLSGLVDSRSVWTGKCGSCGLRFRGTFDDLVPVVRAAINAGRSSVDVPRSFLVKR